MSYKLNLNCADQVRFTQAIADTGLTEDDLVKVLVRDFFARMGVKNPTRRTPSPRKICRSRRV